MRRRLAVLAAFAACALPLSAPADTIVAGVAVGTPLEAVLKALGTPDAAQSRDTGNEIVWRTPAGQTGVIVEDGVVDAVVYRPVADQRITVDFDGKPISFSIGKYTADQADAQLAADAQFSDGTTRTYIPAPGRELVLSFDQRTNVLASVAYGARGTIARLGYVRADDIATSVPYHAAVLNKSAIKDSGAGPGALIAYSVDRHGIVKSVAVLAPSGVAAFDEMLASGLLDDKFTPAHLGGREIASTYYRMVHAP
jgi:hypothetical protein